MSIVILHKILCSVVCGDEGSGGDTELSGCGPATLFRQWTNTKLVSTTYARALRKRQPVEAAGFANKNVYAFGPVN